MIWLQLATPMSFLYYLPVNPTNATFALLNQIRASQLHPDCLTPLPGVSATSVLPSALVHFAKPHSRARLITYSTKFPMMFQLEITSLKN